MTKFKNSNCYKTQNLKMWQNSNCDKIQKKFNFYKTWIVTNLNLWKEKKTLNSLLVRTFWHLDNWWEVLWAAFCDSRYGWTWKGLSEIEFCQAVLPGGPCCSLPPHQSGRCTSSSTSWPLTGWMANCLWALFAWWEGAERRV